MILKAVQILQDIDPMDFFMMVVILFTFNFSWTWGNLLFIEEFHHHHLQ